MGNHTETAVIEPVCIGAVWDGREGQVQQLPAPIGQGPQRLGSGGKFVTAVGQGGQLRAVDAGQPQHSSVRGCERMEGRGGGVYNYLSVAIKLHSVMAREVRVWLLASMTALRPGSRLPLYACTTTVSSHLEMIAVI